MQRETAFWSVRETAIRLGLSQHRTYSLIRAGLVPHVRRGRRVVVPVAAFEAWAAAQAARALDNVRGAQASAQ